MGMEKELEKLTQMEAEVRLGGSEKAIEEQHKQDKLTARERVELFFDKDTFVELDMFGTVQIELDDFFDPILAEDGGNADEMSTSFVLALAKGTARNYSLFIF